MPNFASIDFFLGGRRIVISHLKTWEERKLRPDELRVPGREGSLLGPIPEDRLSMRFLKNVIFIKLFY